MVRVHERLEEEDGIERFRRVELLEAMEVALGDDDAAFHSGGGDPRPGLGHLHAGDVERRDTHFAVPCQPERGAGDPAAGVEDAHAGRELGLVGDVGEELPEVGRALRLEGVAEGRHVALVPLVVVARDALRAELGRPQPAAEEARRSRAHRRSRGRAPLPATPGAQTRMPAVRAGAP